MQEVQVLEATRTAPNSRGRVRSNPITVERIRVAAYVRVSTDDCSSQQKVDTYF